MSYQHKDLAAGRWGKLSFFEQMANIGSEVERALNWRAKNNTAYSRQAAERVIELMGLTIEETKNPSHLKELARGREAIADYFFGENQFNSSGAFWKSYFSHFTYAARRDY